MTKIYKDEDDVAFVVSNGLRVDYQPCLDSIPFEHDDKDTEFFYLDLQPSGKIALHVELDRHPDEGPRATIEDVYSNPMYEPVLNQYEYLTKAKKVWFGLGQRNSGQVICSKQFDCFDDAVEFAVSDMDPIVERRVVRAVVVQ